MLPRTPATDVPRDQPFATANQIVWQKCNLEVHRWTVGVTVAYRKDVRAYYVQLWQTLKSSQTVFVHGSKAKAIQIAEKLAGVLL